MSITLTASSAYGYAGQQYVARIFGLDQKRQFRSELLGKPDDPPYITTVDVDASGLYAVCDVTGTGTKYVDYHIIASREGEVLALSADEDNLHGVSGRDAAMQIAKRLEQGEPIEQIIELRIDKSGRPKYRIRKKAEMEPAGDTEATPAQES